MDVKIINKSKNEMPKYSTKYAVGLDLRANLEKPLVLEPGDRKLIGTGLYIELPINLEAQIRPRSGLALNHGITVLNSPGTIDPDYRGEIKILLINLGSSPFAIDNGERIAQMVFQEILRPNIKEVQTLSQTERGEGGYGSTGVK